MSTATNHPLPQRLRENMFAYGICLEAADRIEALEEALRQLLQATGEGPRRDAASYKARAALNDRR